jgi:hypothetical protein
MLVYLADLDGHASCYILLDYFLGCEALCRFSLHVNEYNLSFETFATNN